MRHLLLLSILLSMGCTAHVFSPPANVGLAETARTVSVDNTRIGAQVTRQGDAFGPEATVLSARMRQGIAEAVEIGADAHLIAVGGEPADKDLNQVLGAVRIGAKWEVVKDYVALTGGAGGGFSAGGAFIAPDLGFVLAFENQYVIPYGAISGFLSQPIDAKPVDISNKDDEVGTNVQTPELTYGLTWGAGIRIPLYLETGLQISPYIGLGGSVLVDAVDDVHMVGLTSGIDVTF